MMRKSPYMVGLTGGIGSGKSVVADLFAAHGVAIVDTDAIAHACTAPGGPANAQIRASFGESVMRRDGALDRDAMRALAFSDPAARQRLEAILHPVIRAEADRQCAAAMSPYVILAVPLLIETNGYRERCDRVCVVDCPVETQIARVIRRNKLDESQIRAIIAAQASREERLAAADDIIDNSGDPTSLAAQVERLHATYLRAARPCG